MKQLIFTCPTLKGELLEALDAAGNESPVLLLPQRLHSYPDELHDYLQDCIDRAAHVDRVILLPSGCGGSTVGLRAGSAPLVIPRSRDCIDILLSDRSLADAKKNRDGKGVFMTKDWAEFQKRSSLDYDTLVGQKGEDGTRAFLKRVYGPFNHFYLIDTGCYELEPVQAYLQPTLDAIDGSLTVLPGPCGILKKVAAGLFDDDFRVTAPGDTVPKGFSMPNFD